MSRFVITLEEYNTETEEVVKRGFLAGIAPNPAADEAPEGEVVPVGVVGVGTVEDAILFGMPESVNSLYHMLTDTGGNCWPAGEKTAMRLTGIHAVGFTSVGQVFPPPEKPNDDNGTPEEPELH